ncbi:MAG TPA: AAA family ATPase [Chitinophagaceae bacterium]|nr:AAA family ATPase [Chitinophagaceae bacterium]
MLKKVVIIGPESTGKSTLCMQLAAHYQTLWCPEFARKYLLEHGMDYTYDDLLVIAKGQIELEEEYIEAVRKSKRPEDRKTTITDQKILSGLSDFPTSSLLFIDTDMYVMKTWCEFVFGKCHQFILDQIAARKYDLYLLCNIDLPWIKDDLREYPDLEIRRKLYSIYKNEMQHQSTPWVEISGGDEERLEKAIAAVSTIVV